ncbi:MAG: YIP1 family protein [Candidatus Bathyarchaeota archaeon]|nr:MAG: YIP1 family protein [Candidatus Bathyarchaeota archaeon]
MSDTKKGFIGKMAGVMSSPRRTFMQIDEGDLWKGALIVLLASMLSAWAGMTYASKMEFNMLAPDQPMFRQPGGGYSFFHPGVQDSQQNDQEAIRNRLIPFIAIGNGVTFTARWLVSFLLVLFAAKILVGKGSSKRMLAMIGFAYLPMLAQQVIRLVDALMITPIELAAHVTSMLAPTTLFGKVLNQAMIIFTVFGFLTLILTSYAVSVNYETTTRRALAVTLLAHVVYIILRIYVPII